MKNIRQEYANTQNGMKIKCVTLKVTLLLFETNQTHELTPLLCFGFAGLYVLLPVMVYLRDIEYEMERVSQRMRLAATTVAAIAGGTILTPMRACVCERERERESNKRPYQKQQQSLRMKENSHLIPFLC